MSEENSQTAAGIADLAAGSTSRVPQADVTGTEEGETMGWKIFDEPVLMIERRFEYFPRLFRWRGEHYRVQAVEECWTVSRRDWRRRVERHYFRVACVEGTFELYQDVKGNTWHLRRARLARRPARWLQHAAPAW